MFPTFESVGEILKSDLLRGSFCAVLHRGTVYYLYKAVLTFRSVDEVVKCGRSRESCTCVAIYYAVQVYLTLYMVPAAAG